MEHVIKSDQVEIATGQKYQRRAKEVLYIKQSQPGWRINRYEGRDLSMQAAPNGANWRTFQAPLLASGPRHMLRSNLPVTPPPDTVDQHPSSECGECLTLCTIRCQPVGRGHCVKTTLPRTVVTRRFPATRFFYIGRREESSPLKPHLLPPSATYMNSN